MLDAERPPEAVGLGCIYDLTSTPLDGAAWQQEARQPKVDPKEEEQRMQTMREVQNQLFSELDLGRKAR